MRPKHIPQEKPEETFAWPADDKPPYPSLPIRIIREIASYVILIAVLAVLLQVFTPFQR